MPLVKFLKVESSISIAPIVLINPIPKEAAIKAKAEADNAKESLSALNNANRKMEELKRLYTKERESNAKSNSNSQAMEVKFEEMQVELKETMEHNIELQNTIETLTKQIELVEEHINQKDADVY